MESRFTAGSLLVAACLGAPAQADAQVDAQVDAQDATPLTVVVIEGADDGPLVERLRGQTSDLDVTLRSEPAGPSHDRSLEGRMQRASAAARASGADAALWVERDGDTLALHLMDAAAERILIRRFELDGADDAEAARSAQLEAAAVAVRTALWALSEGAEIGDPTPPVEPAQPLEQRTPQPEPRPEPERPVPPPAPAVDGGELAVAYQGLVDGLGNGGHGALLDARLRFGGLVLGVTASGTWPRSLAAERATVRLTRATVALRVGWTFGVAADALVTPALEVGLAVFHRSTRDAAEGVEPTPNALSTSALASPGVDLSLGLGGGLHAFGRLAADLVPAAPAIGYEQAGEFHEEFQPFAVQPRLAVGLEARWR